MSRAYRGIRPKSNFVYSRKGIIALFDVSENTISNWINAGLKPVDDHHPMIFSGVELIRYKESRRAKPGLKKRLGEFECYTCKNRVFPEVDTIQFEGQQKGLVWVFSRCPNCNGTCQKFVNETNCNKLKNCIYHNIGLYSCDEEEVGFVAGVGKNVRNGGIFYSAKNERIIFEYLVRLGGQSSRTTDADIAVVRGLEAFVRKSFARLIVDDIAQYRNHLIDACLNKSEKSMSRSTVRHRVSSVIKFLKWLVDRPDCHLIDKRLPEYIVISKSMTRVALQLQSHPFMSIGEVETLVQSAPASTWIQRRDRAIVVVIVAFGTRSNTTASLLMRDLNTVDMSVRIDAAHARAKGGKSYLANCFPDGWQFVPIIRAWKDELLERGLGPNDALFPPDRHLKHLKLVRQKPDETIKPWKTDAGIRQAFERTCKAAGIPYFNPHSMKHFLKSRLDFHCKTQEERKAYSMNFGHENGADN